MNEVWKTVVIDGVEHPRYQVSNLGRVKCLDWYRSGKEKILQMFDRGNGYLAVNINGKMQSIHRLVAEAFLPNPQNKPCIDHIDTNRQRNVIEVDENGVPVENSTLTNIRWATHKENNNNAITRKRKSENNWNNGRIGEKSQNAKKVVQLTLDGKLIKVWNSMVDAERTLSILATSITKCCRGEYKSAGGFKWMYLSDWLKVCKRKPEDIKPLF